MALWHRFKPLKLFIDDVQTDFINDSALIAYYPSNNGMLFEIKYFDGTKSSFLGFTIKKKSKINLTLACNQFEVILHLQGDEQTKQIKNLGGGAILGAIVAGPIGAAAGAYIGSKLKECPCIIRIPEYNISIQAMAPIGYIKEHQKNKFFNEVNS